ncbi:MAG: hypothetical protein LAP40_02250 [Acidobacteriia bacterium]|nr:hypothetical protein [Terriglobia bacterium]
MGGLQPECPVLAAHSPESAAHPETVVAWQHGPYTGLAVCPHRKRDLALLLVSSQLLWSQGNSWNKIRYSGGTVPAKVNPYDWNTTLTVSPDLIRLVFAGRTSFDLTPSQITALSYGEEAHRRVADMVTLSVVLVNPLVLFGILHRSKNHFVGIEFRGVDGKNGAVLLEADKNNYRAILQALKTVTGKPVQNSP